MTLANTHPLPTVALVFDFGGVLFNWRPTDLVAQCFPDRASGPEAAQALMTDIFQGLTLNSDWAAFDQGKIAPEPLAKKIAARTGLPVSGVASLIAAIPDHLTPKADTVELLARLHDAEVPLYFLSNMPAPYARELQARHAFLSYFQAGVFSGEVGVSKPDAAIYDLAVAASGRAKGSLLFVDDLAENIAVAESLGWQGGIVFKSAEQVGKALEVRGIL